MPTKKQPVLKAVVAGAGAAATAKQKRGRDDFKAPVKVLLAQRVGYLCSNPECQAPTIGPRMGESGVANVGVAAHIKAASKGFARYDEHQTAVERGGFENGIWLCQTHSKLIDHDAKTFTVEKLHEWKKDAEQRAFEQLLSGHGPAKVYRAAEALSDEVAELRALLALPKDMNVDDVRARVATGSLTQIEAFEWSDRWPKHLVDLELAVEGDGGNSRLAIGRFGTLLSATQKIVLVSPPGTGKSTTLVQIARRMLAEGPVPVVIPLGEWAESKVDLFSWVVARHGYEGLNTNHLKFLAHQGELALLLDGYNEVPPEARVALMQELKTLQREYPLLNVVISSRRETRNLPLAAGHRLVVMPLSDEQQLEMATALRGKDGESILDAAWRTPGLADLVTIPLYLRSLLESTTGTALPETKEEVLRGMVHTHESEPANQEIFHQRLLDEQQRYLTALAVTAQKLGTPNIPEGDARRAIGSINRSLIEEGITASPLAVPQVLDVLVASHLLVRDAGGTFSFQHQQIQEWYASIEFEEALDGLSNQLSMTHPFAVERLNDPNWGEVVMFACERMARRDAKGAAAVAVLVELMLSIDPLFAAKLISRSNAAVLEIAAKKVVGFGKAWHASRSVLAVAFMIESRRPEFSEFVWPLVSGQDNNQMATMRLVHRFNPGVLGEKLTADYSTLPDRARETLVAELASDGDRAGIDMAFQLALREPSIQIRRHVFESLAFRRATNHMEDLLRQSGDELAEEVARHGYWEGLRDASLIAELEKRRNRLSAADVAPERQLSHALYNSPVAEIPAVIARTLASEAYSVEDAGVRPLHAAWERFPAEVAAALTSRVERGLKLPFRPQLYMQNAEEVDDGPIADRVLNTVVEEHHDSVEAFLVGPTVVGQLLERFLDAQRAYQAQGQHTVEAYRPVRELADTLQQTRASVLFKALGSFAGKLSPSDITALAHVISRHGQLAGPDVEWLALGDKANAVALLNSWSELLLERHASRHDMAELTWAMKRVADPSQVPLVERMLEIEIAEGVKAKASFEANQRDQAALREMQHPHQQEYRTLLTDIGTPDAYAVLQAHLGNPYFATEAAVGMQVMWRQWNEPAPASENFVPPFPDFERAAKFRAGGPRPVSDTAQILLDAAKEQLAESTPISIGRAVQIAGNAVLLPHGDQQRWFDDLIDATTQDRGKLDLARRMVSGGLVVQSRVILAALETLVRRHKERGNWIHDNDIWEFMQWLELLPATERPESLLDGWDMLADFKFGFWRLRDAVGGLKLLPEAERMAIFRQLIEREPKFAEQYEFYRSLRNPGAPTLDLLVDIAAGKYGKIDMSKGARFDYPDELYDSLGEAERASLPARFKDAASDGARVFIGKLLLASGHHGTFMMLSKTPIGRHIIKHESYRTLEELLFVRQPVSPGSSSYELMPRSVEALRKGLFVLTASEDAQTAAFAADYLNRIDTSRAEEGAVDGGARHPDIESGRPWPAVTVPADPVKD